MTVVEFGLTVIADVVACVIVLGAVMLYTWYIEGRTR